MVKLVAVPSTPKDKTKKFSPATPAEPLASYSSSLQVVNSASPSEDDEDKKTQENDGTISVTTSDTKQSPLLSPLPAFSTRDSDSDSSTVYDFRESKLPIQHLPSVSSVLPDFDSEMDLIPPRSRKKVDISLDPNARSVVVEQEIELYRLSVKKESQILKITNKDTLRVLESYLPVPFSCVFGKHYFTPKNNRLPRIVWTDLPSFLFVEEDLNQCRRVDKAFKVLSRDPNTMKRSESFLESSLTFGELNVSNTDILQRLPSASPNFMDHASITL